MTILSVAFLETPVGILKVTATDRGISGIVFAEEKEDATPTQPEYLTACLRQLAEYFAGERSVFDSLPLAVTGTDFQQRVWDALSHIPYGDTVTYGAIAKDLGMDKGFQAVGSAVGANPLCILVPCHRVVGADGALTGYAWGVERKQWLLEHERKKAVDEEGISA